MKKTTRKLLSLAMASAMAASLLTGCGGGGANETTAAAGTEKTEAGKTETEAGPTRGSGRGNGRRRPIPQECGHLWYDTGVGYHPIPTAPLPVPFTRTWSATSFMTVWLLLKRPEPM